MHLHAFLYVSVCVCGQIRQSVTKLRRAVRHSKQERNISYRQYKRLASEPSEGGNPHPTALTSPFILGNTPSLTPSYSYAQSGYFYLILFALHWHWSRVVKCAAGSATLPRRGLTCSRLESAMEMSVSLARSREWAVITVLCCWRCCCCCCLLLLAKALLLNRLK